MWTMNALHTEIQMLCKVEWLLYSLEHQSMPDSGVSVSFYLRAVVVLSSVLL